MGAFGYPLRELREPRPFTPNDDFIFALRSLCQAARKMGIELPTVKFDNPNDYQKFVAEISLDQSFEAVTIDPKTGQKQVHGITILP